MAIVGPHSRLRVALAPVGHTLTIVVDGDTMTVVVVDREPGFSVVRRPDGLEMAVDW